MNHNFLIRATNRVALYATSALIYCVFIFLIITVFDLRIFRERLTETFFLSLLGIFAILGGSVILSIMSNLSKISQAISTRQSAVLETPAQPRSRLTIALVLLTFPLIGAALFAGNELSTQRKKDFLIRSAEKLVSENQPALAQLANYQFSADYVKKSEAILGVITKIDKHFPEVMLIAPDAIDGKALFLAFGKDHYRNDKEPLEMSSFIFSASQDERNYLARIFSTKDMGHKFDDEKGKYQLYFPVEIGGKKLVLYFSDDQRYGKLGS
jgi:hypothetical protein